MMPLTPISVLVRSRSAQGKQPRHAHKSLVPNDAGAP